MFVDHELALGSSNRDQDYLWKIVAPATIAVDVIRELHLMNITPHSLFGSEDALIETLTQKVFLLDHDAESLDS